VRRLITSWPGKIMSQLLVLALVLPSLTLLLTTSSQAQLTVLPTWAVLGLGNKAGGVAKVGSLAAEAMASELAKSGKYDVLPQETVRRTLDTLGLQPPVTDRTSLYRLGQNLRATSLVTGQIINQRVRSVNGGKQADVIVRVEVLDSASASVVNGAALSASSSVRTGTVSDETLLAEAFQSAATAAVVTIQSRNLPAATILNTLESVALINQGSRVGFSNGQNVIVTRNREQVATAKVFGVEPDSSNIRVERSWKGLQPGDKVRVVFSVPPVDPKFQSSGDVRVIKPRSKGNNSGVVSVLLVLGLVALLAGGAGGSGGSGGSGNLAKGVQAESYIDETGRPAVRISWSTDLFGKGNANRVAWQV